MYRFYSIQQFSYIKKIAFCRFAGESAIRQLPVWVRPQVKKYDVFGRALRDMIVFFKTAEQTVSIFLILLTI